MNHEMDRWQMLTAQAAFTGFIFGMAGGFGLAMVGIPAALAYGLLFGLGVAVFTWAAGLVFYGLALRMVCDKTDQLPQITKAGGALARVAGKAVQRE